MVSRDHTISPVTSDGADILTLPKRAHSLRSVRHRRRRDNVSKDRRITTETIVFNHGPDMTMPAKAELVPPREQASSRTAR